MGIRGIRAWRALAGGATVALAALAAPSLAQSPAPSQTLRIGLSAAVTSMDPHYYNATPNNTIAMHVFETLVAQDGSGRLKPALATSWKATGDTTWEFKLREGVRWHDGKPFTAADVAFALERLKNVPGAPGGFSGLVNTVASVQAVNPTTVLIRTTEPSPNIPVFMTFLAIVSAEHGRNAKTEDYNSGKAMVGTGPYRFVRQVTGESVELARNDDWWGAVKPVFARVTFRIVPTLAVRTTSLLAGDLDVIEAPAATDLARLRADPKVAVFSTRSSRVSYVNPIQQPAADAERVLVDGKPAERTPFADARVRRALSMAINRTAIVERVMLNTAEATGQIMPAGLYSSVPDIGVPPYDPAQAKKLLAEAGYPNGFALTLVAANDRVPYNVEVAQAIAQMWSRVGVDTKVNGVPTSIYAGLASNQRIAAYVGSWGSASMEVGTTLGVLLRSYDKAAAKGTYNWSRYSNPELDRLVDKASTVLDPAQREKMLQDATRVAIQDQALIPLFHFVNGWAARAGLVYEPRADGMTLAQDVRLGTR